jgi:hypothetical protein
MKRLVLALYGFLALLALVVPAAAGPRIEHVEHAGRVTVYAEPGLDEIAADLGRRAEAALDEITADVPSLKTPAHIELRVVRDSADLAGVAPAGRGAPPWAVGVAYPDLGIMSVALRRGPNFIDPVFTLRHELAHLVLGAALGKRAPHWLHEGFAYQHSPELSRERVDTLIGMAWFGNVIPIRELDRSFPADELPAHRAYAQSYDFVGYLARRGRWEDTEDDGDRFAFRRFLHEIGSGASVDTAAIKAYGRPLDSLFAEWKADLAKRYRLLPISLLSFGLWILAALLLVLAFLRRRRQNRNRLKQWDKDEEAKRSARESEAQLVAPPPYVPWPGEDPLAEEPDEDRPNDPRLMN